MYMYMSYLFLLKNENFESYLTSYFYLYCIALLKSHELFDCKNYLQHKEFITMTYEFLIIFFLYLTRYMY